MTDHTLLTCREFVAELASKSPAPGGGGAAALVAAVGMALGNMVGSLTSPNPQYAEVKQDIDALDARARGIEAALLDLVEADAKAFLPLSKAYGMPRATDEERKRKAEVMEACLVECSEVPLAIMELCCEAIGLHEEYAAKGTAIALSDVGCGVVTCKAALQAASLNVAINTASMKDRAHADQTNARAQAMLDEYLPRADHVFAAVAARFA